jgi:hypothetical protein
MNESHNHTTEQESPDAHIIAIILHMQNIANGYEVKEN